MCDKITLLAQTASLRRIICCEHDVAHIVWDNVALRLPLSRLAALGKALDECAQVARMLRIATQDDVCVVFDPHDQYQVWLMGVGFCLTPEDFQTLCGLLQSACRHLATPRACQACPQAAPAPIRTPYHLFSLN